MEIYQLRTFLAVAKTGHLTKAAEKLHISQPAVSKQIRALEEELGVALFVRTPTGSPLTKAGELLLPQAEKTLADALELVRMAKGLQGQKAGTIRLGTIIDPEFLRLGNTLGRLLNLHPRIDVKLTHGISGWILELIRAGELDAGFYLGEVADPAIHATELSILTYQVAAPASWKAEIAAASWKTIMHMPWIGTPLHSSQHRLVKQMSEEQNCTVTTVVEADQESTMRNLVIQGVGLCLLREDIARDAEAQGLLVTWPGTVRLCPLSFIFMKHKQDDVLVEALHQSVLDVWRNVQ
ncbi:LysR family transcriptional regulator [Noviherbaspirillum galbum]|uniref:LysR family transcriptional regulator n=1 Tax=Noviherbaspirillum galbum TaxID=2709383 RepID=A0A6B3SVX8_9BURK|nr:LysR family transcriptional regulator [Noviherbaspirillum galbum]NEX61789.1 LysR family transcriptional regulator [Noviherbaspirillum galbum]